MSVSADFYQSLEWLTLRHRVLRKSRGWCELCGHRGDGRNPLQVYHIKPKSKFPHLALVESNLQVLCKNCNRGKGNTDSTDWRPRIEASPELVEKIKKWQKK
jgi:5-methylcytosine-specific restriction endonuclease McrA